MKHSEIIYNAQNLIAGGLQSDDAIISDDQMAFIINYYRAKLFRQDIDKNRFNRVMYVQNLGRIDLSKVDKNECCDSDPCAMRTKFKLPKVLSNDAGALFTFVGTVDGRPFQQMYHNELPFFAAAKWTGDLPKWYYQNGYIYFVNMPTKLMSIVNIQGIFESPVEAQKFRTCDCNNLEECTDYYDYEYPMPLHQVDVILKLIAETELNILKGIGPDITNNTLNKLAERINNV